MHKSAPAALRGHRIRNPRRPRLPAQSPRLGHLPLTTPKRSLLAAGRRRRLALLARQALRLRRRLAHTAGHRS